MFLLTSGHSGLVVSQQPCCSAVGHCLVPLAPCGLSHLVRRVSQLPCSLKLNFSVVLAASCTLNPGCQDLGLFCRSFLRGTPSSSVQASVPSDALVKPRLDFLLMSRMWALGSGLFGCSVFRFRHESNSKFVTNPSGTTPRGRKPVTVCSRRFLVWLVGGGVFGSWDRCVWLCRGFRWTLVQRCGGPPSTTLGGAIFRPPQNKLHKKGSPLGSEGKRRNMLDKA